MKAGIEQTRKDKRGTGKVATRNPGQKKQNETQEIKKHLKILDSNIWLCVNGRGNVLDLRNFWAARGAKAISLGVENFGDHRIYPGNRVLRRWMSQDRSGGLVALTRWRIRIKMQAITKI